MPGKFKIGDRVYRKGKRHADGFIWSMNRGTIQALCSRPDMVSVLWDDTLATETNIRNIQFERPQ